MRACELKKKKTRIFHFDFTVTFKSCPPPLLSNLIFRTTAVNEVMCELILQNRAVFFYHCMHIKLDALLKIFESTKGAVSNFAFLKYYT